MYIGQILIKFIESVYEYYYMVIDNWLFNIVKNLVFSSSNECITYRSRPRKISSPTGSKDLQMVNISLRVLSRPDSFSIPEIHKNLGIDYDDKVTNFRLLITFILETSLLY